MRTTIEAGKDKDTATQIVTDMHVDIVRGIDLHAGAVYRYSCRYHYSGTCSQSDGDSYGHNCRCSCTGNL